MNRKTTLLALKCLALIAFTQIVNAQQIYTNGPLSTGATSNSGVAAPTGTTWSECQNDTGNTTESNGIAGFSGIYTITATTPVNNKLADDFVVPTGVNWNVTSFDFYAYQTGSAATPMPFDQLRVQVYNGDPAAGGTVIAGNLTTNVLNVAGSGDALMYRLFNSVVPTPTATGITRKIWRLRGDLTVALPAGTYWVAYQVHATNDAAAFLPPVTIPNTRTIVAWNAEQSTIALPAYTPILDTGNPATAADVSQDMAFLVNGTVTLGVDENAFEASISLSPNPVRDLLTISTPTNATINGYEIVDINGRVVKSLNLGTSNITEINVAELSVGNYILKLNSDIGTATKKFIKE